MRIIVVGCGKVGETITEQLIKEGHDISVVDNDPDVVEDITNNLDVLGVVGNGASHEVLLEAGLEQADLLIAVTDQDELNLLCCLIGKKAGGCRTIARVRNPVYNKEIDVIKEELGLSLTINPEFAAAREMSRILRLPSAIKVDTFAKGRVELLKVRIPEGSVLDGCPLMEINARTRSEVLVCAVERGDEVIIPNGRFVLAAGDKISIVASADNGKIFFSRIGVDMHRVRNCLIVGGGTIAYYLALMLEKAGIAVTIIEKDKERCEELSELLENTVIICGDATDKKILIEEGLPTADSFVTLTGIDEANIFMSLYARSCSKAKLITKVNRINFDEIMGAFDLDTIIHPKKITAEIIVTYVRAVQNSMGSNIETLYDIIEDKVEAMEFIMRGDTKATGIPLAQLPTRDNVLIACISRGRQIIIPNGQTVIQEGDSVIVVTTQQGVQDFSDLLK